MSTAREVRPAATDRHPGVKVGDVLRRVLDLYKEHFDVLAPAAFFLSLVLAIPHGFVGPHDPGLNFILLAAGLAIGIVYQGMVASLVADIQAGRAAPSLGKLFAAVGPVLVPLTCAAILYGIATGVGVFLLVIPALVMATFWAVLAPAIAVEKKGPLAAFGRSRQLVRGFARPVFGVILVVAVIVLGVGVIRLGIGEAISGGPFLQPGGPLLRIVLDVLFSTVTGPLVGLVPAVLYFRLLEVKERSALRRPAEATAQGG